MADAKISALPPASALAGTEVLPIVQSGSTKKVATDDLTVKNIRSNATTGLLQIAGPGAGATRTMTVPDANFTAARTDAAQTFLGNQTFGNGSTFTQVTLDSSAGGGADLALRTGGLNRWIWSKSGAETGANAGSNLLLYRYDDAGSYAGNPLLINRQNGQVTFENNIVIKSAGNGISFAADAHATGMTSELLDDYEEGTFTPYIRFGGATTGQSYSLQTGRYTKVGRVVHVQVQIIFSNKGSATGTATINLPFTAAEAGGSSAEYLVSVSYTGYPMTFWGVGDTAITMQYAPEAGGGSNMDQTNFINTSRVYMSFSYIV